MSLAPLTEYVKSHDGTNIAFQVVGDGPLDLLMIPGWTSHLDLDWESEPITRFVQRLASFARLIRFDKRGTGLSDRVGVEALPTLEDRMEDALAVLDAARSDRPALFGYSEGGPLGVMFATTYPSRTTALVLYAAHAVGALPGDDYSFRAALSADPDGFAAAAESGWGKGFGLEYFAPAMASDSKVKENLAKRQRSSASPAAAATLVRMSHDSDVRDILGAVQAPTLVLHRAGDRAVGVAHGRFIAERIPNARYIELKGDIHYPYMGDSDAVVGAIQEFLTGVRTAAPEVNRVLSTIVFTDIVDSTATASHLGDRLWLELLAQHDGLVRRELERYQGREVDHTGDGFMASFDGPARAIRCAQAIVDGAESLGIKLRAGLHTGECEMRGGRLGGIAVHIAARVAAVAGPGEILVSGAVPPLVVGSKINFSERGERELKGVPGAWQIFAVAS